MPSYGAGHWAPSGPLAHLKKQFLMVHLEAITMVVGESYTASLYKGWAGMTPGSVYYQDSLL